MKKSTKSLKKLCTLALILTCVGILFSSCSSMSSLKDGKYKAEFADPDDHGWTDYVNITVTDSKISEVTFDSLSADGKLKTEDKDYEESMKKAGSSTVPNEFYKKLAAELVSKQKIGDVEVVAGATTTSNDFKKLVKELEKSMKKGDTNTLKVAR
ncbi:MAG: FMN-binding protein [Oscillospiraceae bacterium]